MSECSNRPARSRTQGGINRLAANIAPAAGIKHLAVNSSSAACIKHPEAGSAPAACIKHPAAGSAPAAGIKHPAANIAPAAGIKHPAANSAPAACIKHPAANSVPAAGIKHPAANIAPAAGIKHLAANIAPAAGIKHLAVNSSSAAGINRLAANIAPAAGIKHPAAGSAPAACIKHPAAGSTPAAGIKHLAANSSSAACIKHPAAGNTPAAGINHPAAGSAPAAFMIRLAFLTVVIAALMRPMFASAASETYIQGADLVTMPSLDLWHHSGGYWAVGNAGSDKIIIDDTEMEARGYFNILAEETAEFQLSLPAIILQLLAQGKGITCRVEGRMAPLEDLFDPDSVEYEMAGSKLYFRAKPKFNLIPDSTLSFPFYGLMLSKEVPLIDRAFGYNIYSLFGNGESGAQADGRVSVANPYAVESGFVHPAMIVNTFGALSPGHTLYIRNQPVDSAGYRVGDGTFVSGGAVGLSFSYPLRFRFYEVDPNGTTEPEAPDPNEPENPPVQTDITVAAALDLPETAYEGHKVYATDASLFTRDGETISALRAYSEGLATNRFSILPPAAGTIAKKSAVRAEAVFPNAGRYSVRLNAETTSGHAGQDTKSIDVLATPAILHTLTGVQKQNRKQVITARIATNPVRPLAHVDVTIEWLDTGETVVLRHHPTGTNTLTNSASIKTRPVSHLDSSDEYFEVIRLEFLLKNNETANCRYTIHAEDTGGKSATVSTGFSVAPDRPPDARIELADTFVRGAGSNIAEIEAEDASTTDGDQLDRTWFYRRLARIGEPSAQYPFEDDPDNPFANGSAPDGPFACGPAQYPFEGNPDDPLANGPAQFPFEDDPDNPFASGTVQEDCVPVGLWIPIDAGFQGYEDRSFGTGKIIGFDKEGVGPFELGLIVKDRWTEETLAEYVTEEDRLESRVTAISDVVNIAPVVDVEPLRLQTADVTILAGGRQAYDAAAENRSRLESELLARGIDADVTVARMTPEASETIAPGAVRTAEVQTPFGNEGNWLFYESDNYIVDETHLYKLDATWAGDSLNDYPSPPYTISCWAFDAGGTADAAWTYTFSDDIFSIPPVRGGPYFAQDDAGRYLFFVAGGRTLVLAKDNGQMLTVLDGEVGRTCFAEGNRIYTFLPGGITRISAVSGQMQTMFSLPVLPGFQRKLWGQVHFVTGAGTDMRRGLFDPATERLSLETLHFEDPVYGRAQHDVLAIDIDGRIAVNTQTYGRVESGGSAGEFFHYYTRTHVYGRDNRLLFATPAKQDSTTYPCAVAAVPDEGGALTHIAHTWDSRSSSARYGYAQAYRIGDGATLTGSVKGGKDDYPTASNKILFARDIAGEVFVVNGAEWVYVWNTGYHIYQERAKAFVFDFAAGAVRTGNQYNELGIGLSTFESGRSSDTLAVVQAGYNTPGNGYSLNQVLRWDQTLPMILKRYASRMFRGGRDLNVFAVCDAENPDYLYVAGAGDELAALLEAKNGRFVRVSKQDLEGDGLLDLIARPEAEERGALVATVPAGGLASVSKSFRLMPGRTYYVEYDVALGEAGDGEGGAGSGMPEGGVVGVLGAGVGKGGAGSGDAVSPSHLLHVTHELKNTPGAAFGPHAWRTVTSYMEDFEDADRVNPFFRFNREPFVRTTGTNPLVHEGYYKGADLRISAKSNVYSYDPYPSDATALKFTVPEGRRAFLSFDYLMQKEAEMYGGQRWMQSYVKIDVKLWAEYNVAGGRGHYSHPELLEAGEHTLTFFASHYGRNEQAKMWLENIRVDLLEPAGAAGGSGGAGSVADGLWTPDLQAQLQDVSARPLGDGYVRVTGRFDALPYIPVYREVENAIVIDGPIHAVPHVTVTNSTSENYAFQLNVPSGKTAIFTRIPTTSYSYGEQAVQYSVPMFTYRSDGKTYWATDMWYFRPKIKNAQENMFNWPADGVITAGPLREPKVFSLYAWAYRYAYGSMDGVTSVMVDAANEHWGERSFFMQKDNGETRYMLEGGAYQGAELSLMLPEGVHKVRGLKVYSIEDGLRRYAADESFADPVALSSWRARGGDVACVRAPVAMQPEHESLVYQKGERIAFDIHYFDYENDPSKRQFWRYTHTPFNDGPHPDAAVILDEYGEPITAPERILPEPIERFYIDGKYTVEHWQEDNTTRPPVPGGNPAYDKPSNVVSITFYVEGGGQAPWIKSIRTIPSEVKEGDTYEIEVEVDDAEGDVLSLTTELYKGRQRIFTHRKEGIEPFAGGTNATTVDGKALSTVDKTQLFGSTDIIHLLEGGVSTSAHGEVQPLLGDSAGYPSGRYPPIRISGVPAAEAASYEIVCTVRDATGAGLGSYRFEVQTEGGIEGKVLHTDEWDANRNRFNLKYFGESCDGDVSLDEYIAMQKPRKRGRNVFWPGENLRLQAKVQGSPLSVAAYPLTRPELICNLTIAGPKDASGATPYAGVLAASGFWTSLTASPHEHTIRFVAAYAGGIEKTCDVTIIGDGTVSYWQLHRLY